MKLLNLISAGILLLIHCISCTSNISGKIITIEPYQEFLYYEHFNTLVLKSPDSHARHIKDLDFEWGYQYKLQVKEEKLEEPLSDGAQYLYELEKVVSKTKVAENTSFELFINPNLYEHGEEPINSIKPINDTTYLYLEEVEIEVPENMKDSFNAILTNRTSKMGNFVFVNGKRIRLTSIKE